MGTARSLMLRAGLVTVAVAASASFGQVEVIYSALVGANSTPPDPALAGRSFEFFRRPFVSGDGQRWIITGDATGATGDDQFTMTGTGLVGTIVAREGTAAPFTTPLVNYAIFKEFCGINTVGQYALGNNVGGDHTVRFTAPPPAAPWVIEARRGDPATWAPAGYSYGTATRSINITNDNRVGFLAQSVTNGTPAQNFDALVLGNALLARDNDGASGPSNQPGGTAWPWQDFTIDRFFVSADGTKWTVQGFTDPGSGNPPVEVVAVNNAVVLQVGELLSGGALGVGSGGVIDDLWWNNMSAHGDWFTSGRNLPDALGNTRDWAVRNGVVIAATGAPITVGSTETYQRTGGAGNAFFAMTGNNRGDWAVAGHTNNATTSNNSVVVLNGTTVILREGDTVNLPGGGTAELGHVETTNTFLAPVDENNAFLTNSHFYFTGRLRQGGVTHRAFMRIPIPQPVTCTADWNQSGIADADDIFAFLTEWFAAPPGNPCPALPQLCPTDVNLSGTVDADDIFAFLAAWFASEPGTACP